MRTAVAWVTGSPSAYLRTVLRSHTARQEMRRMSTPWRNVLWGIWMALSRHIRSRPLARFAHRTMCEFPGFARYLKRSTNSLRCFFVARRPAPQSA